VHLAVRPGAGSAGEPVVDRYPVLASAASGGLMVFAFPPFGFWPAAILSVGMLSLIVHGRTMGQASWYGLIFGLAFCVPVLHWAVTYVGAVGYLLGIVESLFFALMAAALTIVQRLPMWPLWSACVWVAQEAFRSRFPFGGFSWARLAFSQPQGPFLPYAAFGGAPLVTFAVALTGCLAARAFQARLHRGQLQWMRSADTPSTVRHVPIEAVVLTDAELDHTLGILLLREARHLPVYATAAVRAILDHDSRVLPTTQAFSEVPVTGLVLNANVPLRYRDGTGSDLSVEAFAVPAGPPRFARAGRFPPLRPL